MTVRYVCVYVVVVVIAALEWNVVVGAVGRVTVTVRRRVAP